MNPGGLPERPTDAFEDMSAYDMLPRPLRLALAEHPEDLSAAQILDCWMDPKFGPDADVLTRMEWFVRTLTAYVSPSHP